MSCFIWFGLSISRHPAVFLCNHLDGDQQGSCLVIKRESSRSLLTSISCAMKCGSSVFQPEWQGFKNRLYLPVVPCLKASLTMDLMRQRQWERGNVNSCFMRRTMLSQSFLKSQSSSKSLSGRCLYLQFWKALRKQLRAL